MLALLKNEEGRCMTFNVHAASFAYAWVSPTEVIVMSKFIDETPDIALNRLTELLKKRLPGKELPPIKLIDRLTLRSKYWGVGRTDMTGSAAQTFTIRERTSVAGSRTDWDKLGQILGGPEVVEAQYTDEPATAGSPLEQLIANAAHLASTPGVIMDRTDQEGN